MTIESKNPSNINLPWVEKYRPQTLSELISKDDIVKTINKFIEEKQLPHLLFYGPPGTGKTTTILACAKMLYTPAQFSSMVLELNASDDRGIGIVRGPILNFASTRTIFKSGFKLIILDEADAMTHDAQNALRRIIEKFTDNVRFCIICNYLGKIIPALQSRCTRFRFAPLVSSQILPRLEYVIEQENVKITEDGKKAVLTLGQGDMRRVLNILQSTAISYPEVTEENVYTCVGHPLESDIADILKSLLNDEMSKTYKKIQELKTMKGLALADIITELHGWVHKIEFPSRVICDLLVGLSDIEYNLNNGASENIQLCKLLSTFYNARLNTVALAQPNSRNVFGSALESCNTQMDLLNTKMSKGFFKAFNFFQDRRASLTEGFNNGEFEKTATCTGWGTPVGSAGLSAGPIDPLKFLRRFLLAKDVFGEPVNGGPSPVIPKDFTEERWKGQVPPTTRTKAARLSIHLGHTAKLCCESSHCSSAAAPQNQHSGTEAPVPGQ